jgi:histidinol-phosphate aminotransferase
VASRERLVKQLMLFGFEVVPSAANFVFARHVERDAATMADTLREKGILVRHFMLPRIDQYLRISIGTDAECDALLCALRSIL